MDWDAHPFLHGADLLLQLAELINVGGWAVTFVHLRKHSQIRTVLVVATSPIYMYMYVYIHSHERSRRVAYASLQKPS